MDPDLEIVICTAYSDHSWHQMAEKLNRHDKFVILKKSFDSIEVMQLANAFTERRRLEKELAEYTREVEASELRIRTVLNALPQPVFVLNEDMRIVEFNHAAGIMFDSASEQVVRRRGGDIMHCINSKDNVGGCGQSPGCQSCVVHKSVRSVLADTFVAPLRRRLRRDSRCHSSTRAGNALSSVSRGARRSAIAASMASVSTVFDLKRPCRRV